MRKPSMQAVVGITGLLNLEVLFLAPHLLSQALMPRRRASPFASIIPPIMIGSSRRGGMGEEVGMMVASVSTVSLLPMWPQSHGIQSKSEYIIRKG